MRSQTIERSTSVVQDFSSLGAQQFGAQANLSMAEQLPAAPSDALQSSLESESHL
jgi:hypothetical protein